MLIWPGSPQRIYAEFLSGMSPGNYQGNRSELFEDISETKSKMYLNEILKHEIYEKIYVELFQGI